MVGFLVVLGPVAVAVFLQGHGRAKTTITDAAGNATTFTGLSHGLNDPDELRLLVAHGMREHPPGNSRPLTNALHAPRRNAGRG